MKLINEVVRELMTGTSTVTTLAKQLKRRYNISYSKDTIRKALSVLKELILRDYEEGEGEMEILTLTGKKLNGEGKVISETFGLRNNKDVSDLVSDMSIKRISKSPNGGAWVIYENDKVEAVGLQEVIDSLNFKNVPKKVLDKGNWYTDGKRHSEMWNISDVHLGMSTKGGVFDLEWCVEEYYKRLTKFIESVGHVEYLVINQLGDFTDGMKARTSRGGHSLQQNLNDKEMFRHGLESVSYLLDGVSGKAGTVEVNWLCNSNHPGVTDYNIGLALEKLNRWDNVKINVIEDFLHKFEYEGKNFILTHGYDEELMNRPLPNDLKAEHVSRLQNYFFNQKIEDPILLRGDRHQYKDVKVSSAFRDILTPAFSNPSGWVQINFMADYKGGFTRIIVEEDGSVVCKLIEF